MKLVVDHTLWMLLRLGVAACFIGHGAFGVLRKEGWLPYFRIFGIEPPLAEALMVLIGIIDISVGVLALAAPHRLLLGYAAFWCAWTALLRPLAGEPVWETLERAGNYGVPLAMLALLGVAGWWRKRGAWAEWADPVTAARAPSHAFAVLRWTTVALLVGHGMLALTGKPLLAEHVAVIGLGTPGLRFLGGLELALAAAVALRPAPALLLVVVAWKLGTEALFPLAGAPFWEFVERGGSYVAPLAAAWMLLRAGVPALGARRLPSLAASPTRLAQWLLPLAGVALGALPAGAAPAPTGPPALAPATFQDTLPGLTPTLLGELRGGGFIVACRHAATDYSRMDSRSVDFDDPSTQRVLSQAGIEQARELGRHVARLRVPFGEVLASPFQRTFASAELMFGSATVANALYGRGGPERRALFTEPVPAGTNRGLVTHQGVLYGLLRRPRGSIGEADCLVVRAGDETLTPLAQIRPGEWASALSAAPVAAQQGGHDHGAASPSPYVDLQSREIKALSDDDLRSLLEGEGMGFALAAELNGYPGPKHVLEMADSLDLTDDQRARADRIMAAMLAEARSLGVRIVEAERALDRAFVARTLTPEALRAATLEIGRLQGELRATHLTAHLAMMDVLTQHQVHRYGQLRGYAVDHGLHTSSTHL